MTRTDQALFPGLNGGQLWWRILRSREWVAIRKHYGCGGLLRWSSVAKVCYSIRVASTKYEFFTDANGSRQQPPWGSLTRWISVQAIYAGAATLGEFDELKKRESPNRCSQHRRFHRDRRWFGFHRRHQRPEISHLIGTRARNCGRLFREWLCLPRDLHGKVWSQGSCSRRRKQYDKIFTGKIVVFSCPGWKGEFGLAACTGKRPAVLYCGCVAR